MNYLTLKTELQEVVYQGLSDSAAALLLNEKTIPAKQSISSHDITQYLMTSGVWLAIKNSGSDTAVTAIDALQEFDSFDVTNAQILEVLTAILSGLVLEVTTNDFVEQHKTDILAMGDKLISRAEELDIGMVTAGDVQAVRSM